MGVFFINWVRIIFVKNMLMLARATKTKNNMFNGKLSEKKTKLLQNFKFEQSFFLIQCKNLPYEAAKIYVTLYTYGQKSSDFSSASSVQPNQNRDQILANVHVDTYHDVIKWQ